jgi:hypothetical protein
MLDSNIFKLGFDASFALNDFGKPRILSEATLIKNVVLFVLFAKAGQYPSIPNIGLDIQNLLYSYFDEIDNNDLRDKIISQCNALGAYFDSGNINVRKIIYRNKPSLMIHVEGTESYPTGYGTNNNSGKYQIGITFDELNQMIYNVSNGTGGVE